jgi:arsenite methyltransferase
VEYNTIDQRKEGSSLEENKRVEEMNYFELLAWLGIGSSHPGGFPATRQNLDAMQIKPEELVLDVGCGSGLTACHLAKTIGCKIIGVDINTEMIDKACQRAEAEGVTHLVEFKVADANNLPFADNSFDLVMGESITVFLDKAKVYREFLRVLKPEGRVADLEMALQFELPAEVRYQMEECFGPATNPLTVEEWCNMLIAAGFHDVEIKNPQPLRKSNSNIILSELKQDWLLIKDLTNKVTSQPGIFTRLQKNAGFTKRYQGYFGFGLFCGRKPTPPPVPKKVGIKDRFLKFFSRK